jgi:hypothetical protein
MNKSQRIYLNTGNTGNQNEDKFITVKLEQDVETLEFMSMTLRTKDVYQNFNADYGVLIGRVLANGGIGIENAKISIFIPITDEDASNPDIYKLYPYTTPRDKNTEGKRYNLLPRVSKRNPETNQLEPKQAFGSFPIKEEIVTNETFLEVYKKYYKYTTTTNEAGDYMIFGVPVGTQTVHMSCDITDIGRYSMNPASMVVNLGYSEAQFTDRNTKIKSSNDLGDLPNIETQEISVDIRPFWGDAENFEIGITRQDFRIRATLTNTFTIFGSAFTDSAETLRGYDRESTLEEEIRDLYEIFPNSDDDSGYNDAYGTSLATKRIGTIKETIYYYPSDMTDAEINAADPTEDMLVLDKSEYSAYYRNGDFVFIINCNRDRVITNQQGNEIPVNFDNPNGVFTSFRGFITLEYTSEELPMISVTDLGNSRKNTINPLRIKLKFPQHAGSGDSFEWTDGTNASAWRKQHMKFEAQKFYSVSKFHGTVKNNNPRDNESAEGQFPMKSSDFFKGDEINYANLNPRFNIGVIYTDDHDGYNNSDYEMIGNTNTSPNRFGANWLNFSVYFTQSGYMLDTRNNMERVRTATFLSGADRNATDKNKFFVLDNNMPIAAGQINTKWYARSDLHWTDIIEVPVTDIRSFSANNKGFKLLNSQFDGTDYRNGVYLPPYTQWKKTWSDPCPYDGGGANGTPGGTDNYYYFYKGFDSSDCIEFLYDLGLVT